MATKSTTKLSIEMPTKEHKKLKILADAMGISLKNFVLNALEYVLYPNKKPNKETIKAIEKIERGEGLIHCDSIEDFWYKAGIRE
ncbi:MAG: hypothetical protein AMS24_03170 [Chlamydiae bacterium SM23_39]|nr:MAG: hypothetical protein AMS24_03170 [Chlamydiae bacterium SM23_39]